MNQLWQKDEFKNKWALVARVWSMIRDAVGKDRAPLHEFLSFACPAMNIVPPISYLSAYNWTIRKRDGEIELFQSSTPVFFDAETCKSETDLLTACIANGYILVNAEAVLNRLAAQSTGIMTAPTAQNARRPEPVTSMGRFLQELKYHPKETAARIIGIDDTNAIPFDVNVEWLDGYTEVTKPDENEAGLASALPDSQPADSRDYHDIESLVVRQPRKCLFLRYR